MAHKIATRTIEIAGLPETLLLRIDARVRTQGGDRDSQIRELLEKGLAEEEAHRTGRSFDEALRTIRQGFAESEMTEGEAFTLLTEELKVVRSAPKLATVRHGG